MYSHSYIMPNNSSSMYRNDNDIVNYNSYPYSTTTGSYPYTDSSDERFFLAPFLFGGLAGTALGYGIANNNQINGHNGGCCQTFYQPMYQPMYPMPYPVNSNTTTNSNNFFY